jgi:hypothetical protein
MEEEIKFVDAESTFSINFSDGSHSEMIIVKSKYIFRLSNAYKEFLSKMDIPYESVYEEYEQDENQLSFMDKLEDK